ncbi:hypothetical protein GQ54DRAFT_297230 [Martensiomyces pterosporus]|nr:hypothetical protein GQ54DRAFT_297230 [Martensiomyces pterosporus]
MPSIGSDNPSSSSSPSPATPASGASTALNQPSFSEHAQPQSLQQNAQQYSIYQQASDQSVSARPTSAQYQQRQSYQQQSQQQAYAYSYASTIPVGSPASPLGFIGSSSPVQAPSPQPVSPLAAGSFALVNAPVIQGAPAQAYTYYPSHGHLGGSPLGSPQLAPHAAVGASNLTTAHFLAPVPISSIPSSPTNPRDPDAQLAHVLQPQQLQQLVGSPTSLGMAPPLAYPGTSNNTAYDPKNVYIRNLPEDCTDESLYRLSTPYGEIESSKSIINEATGKCKGYGFVRYKTEEQAQRAIEAFNAQGLQSTLAKDSLKDRLKRLQDKNSANVYISNLSLDIDEEGLTELIKPYTVVSAKIIRDPFTGQHTGAGFARMPDRETALLVIDKLKGMRLDNSPGPLLPRFADSEGQKQLKKQVNGEGGGRLDDIAAGSPNGVFIRSGAASPLMWSPVIVYSPAGSLPPQPALQGFEPPTGNTGGVLIDSSHQPPRQMSPSPPAHQYIGAVPHQPGYSAAPGMFAIPASPVHYQGYASPSGYASPIGYGSPSGYASPGYVSPTGYTSPIQMPASPQLAYAHLPEQPTAPTPTSRTPGSGGVDANASGGNTDVDNGGSDSMSSTNAGARQQHQHQKQHQTDRSGHRSHHARGPSRSQQQQQRPRQQSRSGAAGSGAGGGGASQRNSRNDGPRRTDARRSENLHQSGERHQHQQQTSAAQHDLAEAMQEKLNI